MALIKLSSIGITNLSGKAGGSVYAHNRGGNYIRNFAVPSNPQTAAQSAARAVFGAFASAWRSLAEDVRQGWIAAAENFPYIDRFGDSKIMSGENLYISLNRNLDVIGESQLTEPPAPQGVDGIITADVSASTDGTLQLMELENVNLAGNAEATTKYAVYASGLLSAGINYAKNKLRYITNLDETEIVGTPDVFTAWTAVFGDLQVGAKVFLRIDPINTVTGERGASLFTSVVVVTG